MPHTSPMWIQSQYITAQVRTPSRCSGKTSNEKGQVSLLTKTTTLSHLSSSTSPCNNAMWCIHSLINNVCAHNNQHTTQTTTTRPNATLLTFQAPKKKIMLFGTPPAWQKIRRTKKVLMENLWAKILHMEHRAWVWSTGSSYCPK